MTKQERTVLCVVIALLLLGAAVKAWRTAHPPKPTSVRRTAEWVARAAAADQARSPFRGTQTRSAECGARNFFRSNGLSPC